MWRVFEFDTVSEVERYELPPLRVDLTIVDADEDDPVPLASMLRACGWPSVVIAGRRDAMVVSETLCSGALAYLFKEHERHPGDIEQHFGARTVHEIPGQSVSVTAVDGSRQELSHREMQILRQIAQGATNTEIAAALGLAPSTVKSHLVRIGQRLQTGDRAHMIALVMRARALR